MWDHIYKCAEDNTVAEWFDDGITVTVSEPQDIINGYKFDHYDHPKESQ